MIFFALALGAIALYFLCIGLAIIHSFKNLPKDLPNNRYRTTQGRKLPLR